MKAVTSALGLLRVKCSPQWPCAAGRQWEVIPSPAWALHHPHLFHWKAREMAVTIWI